MSGSGGGGSSSSGGRINLSACKFGWFWANDVEQTPPRAQRGVKRRFAGADAAGIPCFSAYETPVQQRSGGSRGDGAAAGGSGAEPLSQEERAAAFGGRTAKRVSFEPSTAGETGPAPRARFGSRPPSASGFICCLCNVYWY